MSWSLGKAARRSAMGALLGAAALTGGAAADPIDLSARALAAPARLGAEGARFLAGFELDARDSAFGGYSGLLLEGDILEAVSDRGHALTLTLRRNVSGAITEITGAEITPLLDRRGRPLRGFGVDAEALARGPEGLTWIAFEQRHRVIGVPRLGERRAALAAQLPSDGFEANGGVEALAATRDGALWALLESPPDGADPTRLHGFRLIGGGATRFTAERYRKFAPTGLDVGPDGALYLLERRFGLLAGFQMRLRRFAADTLGAADLGAGETLLALGRGGQIDNMEALAIDRAADGALVATLISDDNFNALQRTVLLQFALPAP